MAGLTRPSSRSFNTKETVETDTPVLSAISFIVVIGRTIHAIRGFRRIVHAIDIRLPVPCNRSVAVIWRRSRAQAGRRLFVAGHSLLPERMASTIFGFSVS